ncbi:8-oxo-dGTP pyrophosphatase MutT (NUDIX family) [Cryobacterium mesophilum]|uniref:NUDIX domain-containing protein n=1 Tax=Terrimesophilobacter mesophilus TaxID=433647 RepID=A0A4R8V7H6_9MICO|nr:NUDIX domain-containing protein [Terrimesophilobacter mesophilus]MBB5631824.1 8-oxo-dGTP pyrophosphatase MutT (NUDIX family) [Terrimesophilobacter mesophilus]TFB78739.1 NUDIX domain-containing protein [Terrimesophilobacter mesophilus]
MNRRAARVILFDEHSRVLLFRGRDSSAPDRGSWWFTPGGGLDPGESPHEAALREVREETGLTLASVSGPVYEQEIDFAFEDVQLHRYEQFFVARVNEFVIDPHGWTDLEKRSMLESRWWSLDELESTTETINPEALAELVRVQIKR